MAKQHWPHERIEIERFETSHGPIEIKYDAYSAKGDVLIGDGGFGPIISVNGEESFLLDLFHKSPENMEYGDGENADSLYQLVIYDPSNPDSDPPVHLMVFKDRIVLALDVGIRGPRRVQSVRHNGFETITFALEDGRAV